MSIKVALLQPIVDEPSKSIGIQKSPQSIQPLAGQLERHGCEVVMFHSKINNELGKVLKDFDPDLLGISTMTPNFPEGMKIASEVKSVRDDILVVLGGWHVSGCVKAYQRGQESESLSEILNPDSSIDYVVFGEGEEVVIEIIDRLKSGDNIDDLSGIGFFDGENIKLNAARRIQDLDSLADPSWEGLPINNYRDERDNTLDLGVHFNRACRFNCGFCSTSTVYGRGVRAFSPERAVDYIGSLLQRFGPEVISFSDEDFFADLDWVETLVDLIKERELAEKYGMQFNSFASVTDIIKIKRGEKRGLLRKMREVGFDMFTIGIESFNPRILRDYNKIGMITATMTDEQKETYKKSSREIKDKIIFDQHISSVQETIDYSQEHGILIAGDYMVGNLNESEEEVRERFEIFCNLRNLLIAYIPTYTPFPGTALWKGAYDSGKLVRTVAGGIDWSRANAGKGLLDLGYDIEKLRDELEVKFYSSDRYWRDLLRELDKRPERITYFKSRFQYLVEKFGYNKILAKRLDGLEKYR